MLALPDAELLALADRRRPPRVRATSMPAGRARGSSVPGSAPCAAAGAAYPERLRDLADPPAVLHVAGRAEALAEADAVAVVGARKASPYGLEVARALGPRAVGGRRADRVRARAGDRLGRPHRRAGGAERRSSRCWRAAPTSPYPSSKRWLYDEVVQPRLRRVGVPARASARCAGASSPATGIIAALSYVTVVVEAAERSGSLTTADFAAELGRTVGAVPGRITCALAEGTNGLLQSGAPPVCGVRDVLDLLAEATGRAHRAEPPPAPRAARAGAARGC